jgi:hypothetical protein
MAAWKGKLSERQMAAEIAFIKELWADDQRRFRDRINQLRPQPQ